MSETYKPRIHCLSKKTDTEVTTISYIRLEVNILFSSWYCLPIFQETCMTIVYFISFDKSCNPSRKLYLKNEKYNIYVVIW